MEDPFWKAVCQQRMKTNRTTVFLTKAAATATLRAFGCGASPSLFRHLPFQKAVSVFFSWTLKACSTV